MWPFVVSKCALPGTTFPAPSDAHADEGREEDVLRGPPLVGREEVLEAENVPHRFRELVVGGGPGIALVAEHHLGPLGGGHGPGTRVGEEVDVHVVGFDIEEIVFGRVEDQLPLLPGSSVESILRSLSYRVPAKGNSMAFSLVL